jgi:leader peptidase (prepilin peptidase)/N-methyltransferase
MLGFTAGFPLSIFLLFVSYMSGAAVGVFLIATGRKQAGSKLPFGSFLGLGAIATLLYGAPLLNWYLKLIGFSTI